MQKISDFPICGMNHMSATKKGLKRITVIAHMGISYNRACFEMRNTSHCLESTNGTFYHT